MPTAATGRGATTSSVRTCVAKPGFSLLESASLHMDRLAHAALISVALLVGSAACTSATEYPGWGDTGWVYEGKRACCNDAISIAAQYSEQACTTAGGMPSPFAGEAQRGSCSWQWMQDANGYEMYRCYGQAAVWCD